MTTDNEATLETPPTPSRIGRIVAWVGKTTGNVLLLLVYAFVIFSGFWLGFWLTNYDDTALNYLYENYYGVVNEFTLTTEYSHEVRATQSPIEQWTPEFIIMPFKWKLLLLSMFLLMGLLVFRLITRSPPQRGPDLVTRRDVEDFLRGLAQISEGLEPLNHLSHLGSIASEQRAIRQRIQEAFEAGDLQRRDLLAQLDLLNRIIADWGGYTHSYHEDNEHESIDEEAPTPIAGGAVVDTKPADEGDQEFTHSLAQTTLPTTEEQDSALADLFGD